MQKFDVEDLELLIDLMASAGGDNGLTMEVWRIISNLIEELSSVPSSEATESLEALSSNANLEPWLPTIADTLHRQMALVHEWRFLCASVE